MFAPNHLGVWVRFARINLVYGLFLIALAAPGSSWATESGGTSKALGVDTVLAGVMPPPGLRLTAFASDYHADRTLDGSGNPVAGLSNFSLKADALTFRLQYVWPDVVFWGANLETRIGAVADVNSRVQFDVRTPAGTTVTRQGSVHGGGDLLLAPALLGWHSEHLHQIAGIEFFLPTGSFNAAQLANPGRGYFSYGATYLATWLPSDAIEVSAAPIYLVNNRNPDTNYRSGQEFSIDYGAGYAPTQAVQIGASGYVYKQLTDDSQNGQTIAGGNRGRAFALGPFIRYRPANNWGVVLKWQHETWVENRPKGDRLFLQFSFKLF
jgi:hypothetical protein